MICDISWANFGESDGDIDGPVELVVQSNGLLLVIAGIGFLELGLDFFEFAQLLVGDIDRGSRSQLPTDVSLNVGDVGDVAPGYRQHHEATAGLLGNQAFGPQSEQRFADGRDTDPQFRGQLVQANVRPGSVAAIEDSPANEARDIVGKLRPGSEIRGAHRLTPDTRQVAVC